MEDVTSVLLHIHAAKPDSDVLFSSGMLFNERYVLTHGSLVSSFGAASNIITAGKSMHYGDLPTVYVHIEHVVRNPAKSFVNQYIDGVERVTSVGEGKIFLIWKCGLLDGLVKNTFADWTIGSKEGSMEQQGHAGIDFLSVFVLIDIGDPTTRLNPFTTLNTLLGLLGPGPGRGGEVVLRGTPFGHEGFLNTETSGLVCAVLDPLLLTDASCSFGCQGGPAFHQDKKTGRTGKPFGMVVNSVAWCRKEWVGLALVACLTPCLERLLAIETSVARMPPPAMFSILEQIDHGVVLVRSGISWGSAVAIGQGYFLTCSHVIKQGHSKRLSLYCLGQEAAASVVYRTPDNKVYDLAVLHSPLLTKAHPIQIAATPAIIGERVVVAGFPYFNATKEREQRPVVTHGTVSYSSAHMVQSTCCVQSGCSGGALLRLPASPAPPSLLGIVVNNTSVSQESTVFPNLNMAISATVFRHAILSYIDKPKASILDFEEKQKQIISHWRLLPEKSKL